MCKIKQLPVVVPASRAQSYTPYLALANIVNVKCHLVLAPTISTSVNFRAA